MEKNNTSDEDSSGVGLVLILLLAACTFTVGDFLGYSKGIKNQQKEAIKAGVAEYYFDKDVEQQFRYVPNESAK